MSRKHKLITLILSLFVFSALQVYAQENEKKQALDLEQCLNLALENNQLAKISDQALKIAKAQHKQVLSSYWPQISGTASYVILDEDPSFVYPEETSGYTIDMPLLSPVPLEADVTIPEKKTKLMDRMNGTFSLDMTYPLYTGGLRSALKRQTNGNIQIKMHEQRQSELQIVLDVKTRYYGNVLAKKLRKLGRETLDRVEVTLEMTENLYKNGSGSVKKTDYLKNKMFAASIRALQVSLENNMELSASALSFTVADPDQPLIISSDDELPYEAIKTSFEAYSDQAKISNPDMNKVNEALNIYDAKIDEAKSDNLFKIALFGKLQHIENSYDAGMVSKADKNSWVIGAGLQLPLFSGFGTKAKIEEMKARLSEVEHKKILLTDGLELQIKNELLKIKSLQDETDAKKDAMQSAIENRDLTERAYAIEMATAQDMIQAQLFESIMIAQYYKSLYDHIVAKAKLDYLVGSEIQKSIEN